MILGSHVRCLELAEAWRRGDSVAELRARFGLRNVPATVSVLRARGYDVPRRIPKKARAADPQGEAQRFVATWNAGAPIEDLQRAFGFASRASTTSYAWGLRQRGFEVTKRLRSGDTPTETEPAMADGPNAWPTRTGTRDDLACLRCDAVGWTSSGLDNRLCQPCGAINREIAAGMMVMVRTRSMLERPMMTSRSLIQRRGAA